ncbi:rod shape-determining protein MreC [Corallincola holothuriorum]|uniref:Cell shape-determining protein MreC n=1 Tax=Corallincola holothuriorum TaxID=2282215 RepID=A0A368NKA4_9GAMM|nr:rod shape-determining protein MreC [Corallincola holothuriorum]RCU49839.1 rod shape-determining protein MreC [Corallincola holothuriorum]
MKPIFGSGPSLQLRLVIAVCLSLALMIADRSLPQVGQFKFYLSTLVSPLQYLANAPQGALDWAIDHVKSRRQLIAENQALREQALLDSGQLQQFAQLKQENERLRALLGSSKRSTVRKMVAEVFAVNSDRYSLQVVIDKGSFDGVYVGQPVLDHEGVVGQIEDVGSTTSRVILIGDSLHSIPVRVHRNDVRAVLNGTGEVDKLALQYVAHSTDVRIGDLLISSGLGGRFPEGYPVAKVTSVESDESFPFAQVTARPIAELDRLRYLLLLWPDADDQPWTKGAAE